ncbi:MAG: cobalamin B12-binding domain-containing protein [Candidatus Helarchaeota archaeon]|nr:cobalamin B12-binding domain-containing protein [Candidatus Helarchaeota archaeon]
MTIKNVKDVLIDLDIEEIVNLIQSELDEGINPQEIMNALTEGMNVIGKLYEDQEYYLAELVLAGEIMRQAMKTLEPHLKSDVKGSGKTIVATTVRGDNHDIGKNILITMLRSNGFNVIDLGMDCPADKIVNAVKESGAMVLALSSLLTMSMEEISVVDKALKDAKLRDQVKIIVGGAPLNLKLAKKLGADAYAEDAVSGLRKIMELFD